MITRERFDEMWEVWKEELPCYTEKNIDHNFKAIRLLRERIPHGKCGAIIGAAEHDMVYLPDVDKVLPFIDEEDLKVLIDCNVGFDSEIESFYMFV